MNKLFAVAAAIGLLTFSQLAISSEQEAFQQRCHEQSVEDKVEKDGYEDYMKDCISFYQDAEAKPEQEAAPSEQESEKKPASES
jgi:hypothetical protein